MDDLLYDLTLIITTSVSPSAPSTELISSIYESFRIYCPSLLKCRVVVVFDGYDRVISEPRLKKGCVSAEQAENYSLYKENVKKFMIEQYKTEQDTIEWHQSDWLAMQYGKLDFDSEWYDKNAVVYKTSQPLGTRITFIEPHRRMGFGLAVHAAVCAADNYVWVHQHDWVLTSPIPINEILNVMRSSESSPTAPVKYVCLPAVRTLKYAVSAEVIRFPALRKVTSELKGDYSPNEHPEVKIPLTPLFSWHDKPHIASSEHYKARVFPSRLALMRGDFIEDKIGQRAKVQMKEGLFTKWATWLYYPDEGKQVCSKHLHGRTYRGAEKEAERIARKRQQREDKMVSRKTEEKIEDESFEGTKALERLSLADS